jgi:photosystem II stability/assembly factor-like uncharacterized protein
MHSMRELRRLLVSRLLAPAAFVGALAAAGCGKNVVQPVIPPLSRVVIMVGADTSVVRDTVKVSGSIQFQAIAYDLAGAPVPGATFRWGSTDPNVFDVNSSGLLAGMGEGEALVIVRIADKLDSVSVLVLPSANGWLSQVSNSAVQLNGVFFDPDGRHGWVVGNGGELLATTDAGATWLRKLSGTTFNLNAVWFTDPDSGWAVGNAGTAIHTTDGGNTWRLIPTSAGENLLDVTFATPDTGWIVGSSGAILRTFNWGGAWSKQNPSIYTLHAVSFSGTRRGWAVGDNGTVLGTVDRGLNWSAEPFVTGQSLRAVRRRSQFVAFAAGMQGVVPRTKDVLGVPTWELQNTGASNSLEGLFYPSDTTGFAVGSNGNALVLRTGDGGLNWQVQTAPLSTALNDVYFVDELRGWAVGDNGRIVHTGSGGKP